MARFLNADQIPLRTRRPHLDRYKKQLREGLLNPSLTDDQKAVIRIKLDRVGMTKPYAELAAGRDNDGDT